MTPLPSMLSGGPGGQLDQEHGVVLHDPGEGYQPITRRSPKFCTLMGSLWSLGHTICVSQGLTLLTASQVFSFYRVLFGFGLGLDHDSASTTRIFEVHVWFKCNKCFDDGVFCSFFAVILRFCSMVTPNGVA